jgi:uncharacterized membrane protein
LGESDLEKQMETLSALLAVLHALAGAAWFGSMFYSLTVMQPRAVRYLERPERFEEFIAVVSAGARWKVLAAFALLAGTGMGLVLVGRREALSALWVGVVVAKGLLWLAALGLFVHVSWRLWPARVLALPEEVPALQRTFRRVGWTMILLVGGNLALGVVAHHL